MTKTKRNKDFEKARQDKKDEFYTSLADIEAELKHYKRHFKDKTVYCNCDDPSDSNFFHYFSTNFHSLGLKKLITTCYRSQDGRGFSKSKSNRAIYIEYTGNTKISKSSKKAIVDIKLMSGDGDFRSNESIELLKTADIVVTNPPFSLFREYVAQLIQHKKKFLIIGNMNAVTYKEIFPLLQKNLMWYGASIRSGDREFRVPDDYPILTDGYRLDDYGNKYIRVKGVRWFTNLIYPGRYKSLDLQMTFHTSKFPKYANYDAIEVSKTQNIPFDYKGQMGVPITFFDKYNPNQFEIIGSSKSLSMPMSNIAKKGTYQSGGPRFYLSNDDGTYRRMYDRIVIRKKS